MSQKFDYVLSLIADFLKLGAYHESSWTINESFDWDFSVLIYQISLSGGLQVDQR